MQIAGFCSQSEQIRFLLEKGNGPSIFMASHVSDT
jgi:hypothetical protein